MVKEEQKKKAHEYYLKNRERHILNVKQRQKQTNYATEKRPEALYRRNIKAKTRHKYPLENKKCERCGNPATCHHHTTDPITVDDFVYSCHECHQIFEKEKKEGVAYEKRDLSGL